MKKGFSVLILALLLTGTLIFTFNVQPANSVWTGTVYIRADGSIDPPDAPITTYDNITYTLTGNITSSAYGIVVERDNIIIDGAGYTIQGSSAAKSRGIDLLSRSNVTIRNLRIKDFRYGILLNQSYNIGISGNNIENNGYGICISHSFSNVISGNNITAITWISIFLNNSFNNVIYRNNMQGNFDGIYLLSSSNNTIAGNNIKNNEYGIELFQHCNNNAVYGNNILANNMYGITLFESSHNVISWNNILANNYAGISIHGGGWNVISGNNITANGGYGISIILSYNEIYHNNFVNNTYQAHALECVNLWNLDFPSGGNYWSDYLERYPEAKELDESGIWDTPYIIAEYNKDYYPLMYPYVPPTYKLQIIAMDGGTTNPPSGTYNYTAGNTVEITAIPHIGFSFDYWLLDGEVRTENPISIVMDSNHTLEAYFVDDIAPEISEPWQDPPADNVQPFQNVTVWVNVSDYGSGVKNVTLWYSIDDGTSWSILNMTELPIPSDTTVTYEATIPGYENCTWITYKIVAYDKAGNNQTKDNNGYGYKYHVIPEFPSTTILPVFMLITLIATVLLKKNRKTNPQTSLNFSVHFLCY